MSHRGASVSALALAMKKGRHGRPLAEAEGNAYSTALTMSSTTFFASPKTIIVLSM
jgi:hypothetical protein